VFLLSGLIFSLEKTSLWDLRWISNFMWGRYYIEVVRDALTQGGGWLADWWKAAIIGLIGSVFYGLDGSACAECSFKRKRNSNDESLFKTSSISGSAHWWAKSSTRIRRDRRLMASLLLSSDLCS